jgi:hypothetical protein
LTAGWFACAWSALGRWNLPPGKKLAPYFPWHFPWPVFRGQRYRICEVQHCLQQWFPLWVSMDNFSFHSFNKYLLATFCVPGTVLGVGFVVIIKNTKNPCLQRACSVWDRN